MTMKFNFVRDTIKNTKISQRLPQLIILVSFVFTYGFIRAVTHLQKAGIIPNQHGSFHLHHMVPGIILLIISGYCGLAYWHSTRLRSIMSVLFGIGAALTIDEFALWLFLQDVYWAKQGRDSVDAVIIVIVLLTISYLISGAQEHKFIKNFFRR